jgi:hypothetical protein
MIGLQSVAGSVLRYIPHERTEIYWRFMGGFGGDSRHHMHQRQRVRAM